MRALRAQTKAELLLSLRRGEAVLLTLIVPLALLAFFGSTGLFDITVDFLVPGLFTLAIISSAFVSLAVATGFERKYLVLKRLGATPLSRGNLIAAKALAIAVLELIQIGLLWIEARVLFDWQPDVSWLMLAAGIILGTSAFSGLAMLLAGTLRAEATLALANGAYVIFLGLGDIIVSVYSLPGPMISAAKLLPGATLAAFMRAALGGAALESGDVWILVIWAVIAPLLATRFFRWEEQ